eukprot:3021869-Amphidinium_carterae.1
MREAEGMALSSALQMSPSWSLECRTLTEASMQPCFGDCIRIRLLLATLHCWRPWVAQHILE